MEILNDVVEVVGAAVKIFSAYFFVILVFALRKERDLPECQPKTRFAVLIPARNEENVIAQIVTSLRTQKYPRELFDIFVIPNNCTDNTEIAALNAGARIIRPRYAVRCKGDVLHETIETLLKAPEGYDAFTVFDADNYVDAAFLSETDKIIQTGARVCKGRQMAKNPYDTATAGCYALWLEMFGRLFNRARSHCGLSARLVGTGFSVHREVFENLGGWNTVTLAEDAEFGAKCAIAGYRVMWTPKAITYDEQPNSIRISLRQRKRWSSGNMHVAQLYCLNVWQHAAKSGPRMLRADIALLMMTPFMQTIALIPMLYGTIAFGFDGLITAAVSTSVYFITTILFSIFLAFTGGYRDVRIIKATLVYPFFMLSWFPLQIVSLFKRTKNWEQIPHEGGAVTFAKLR